MLLPAAYPSEPLYQTPQHKARHSTQLASTRSASCFMGLAFDPGCTFAWECPSSCMLPGRVMGHGSQRSPRTPACSHAQLPPARTRSLPAPPQLTQPPVRKPHPAAPSTPAPRAARTSLETRKSPPSTATAQSQTLPPNPLSRMGTSLRLQARMQTPLGPGRPPPPSPLPPRGLQLRCAHQTKILQWLGLGFKTHSRLLAQHRLPLRTRRRGRAPQASAQLHRQLHGQCPTPLPGPRVALKPACQLAPHCRLSTRPQPPPRMGPQLKPSLRLRPGQQLGQQLPPGPTRSPCPQAAPNAQRLAHR